MTHVSSGEPPIGVIGPFPLIPAPLEMSIFAWMFVQVFPVSETIFGLFTPHGALVMWDVA